MYCFGHLFTAAPAELALLPFVLLYLDEKMWLSELASNTPCATQRNTPTDGTLNSLEAVLNYAT
tara:strand:+ start:195 stop:386 length:192 start_codon:yes stop_codon:yes gene_type:complete